MQSQESAQFYEPCRLHRSKVTASKQLFWTCIEAATKPRRVAMGGITIAMDQHSFRQYTLIDPDKSTSERVETYLHTEECDTFERDELHVDFGKWDRQERDYYGEEDHFAGFLYYESLKAPI